MHPDPSPAPTPLDTATCRALLGTRGVGVVSATSQGTGQPVGWPAVYHVDGDVVRLAAAAPELPIAGSDPLLCLTVTLASGNGEWHAVTVTGHARWISPDGPASALLQLEIATITGCAGTAAPFAPAAERTNVALDFIRRVVRALRSQHAVAERQCRLTGAQSFVLREIGSHPGISATELVRRTATSPSSLSEVVARLTERGLVARRTAAGDRRRVEYTLTAAGHAALGAAPETVQERLVTAFASLSPAQQALLPATLAAWSSAAGLAEVPATMMLEPPGEPP